VSTRLHAFLVAKVVPDTDAPPLLLPIPSLTHLLSPLFASKQDLSASLFSATSRKQLLDRMSNQGKKVLNAHRLQVCICRTVLSGHSPASAIKGHDMLLPVLTPGHSV
jgi:hypothetical protein